MARRRQPGHPRLRARPGGPARGRRPRRAAVAAQPGGAGLHRHRPLGPARGLGRERIPGDQDQVPGRRRVLQVQGAAAARGQLQPGRVKPPPADAVGRGQDQRSGPGRVAAGHARAHGHEAGRRPRHRVDLVTGAQRQPRARRQRPGPAVCAGPDRTGAEGDPRARGAGHEDGAVAGRRHAAVRRPDLAHRPGTAVVGRDVELSPGNAAAGLRSHRHDLVAGAGHPAERLGDAATAGPGGEVGPGQRRGRVAERGRGRGRAGVAAVRARDHHDGHAEDDHGQDRYRHPHPPAAELEPGQELPGPPALDRLGQQRAEQPGPLGAGHPGLAFLAVLLAPGGTTPGRTAAGDVEADLFVAGPRRRRRRHRSRLGHRRRVPEPRRLGGRGLAPQCRLGAGGPGGRLGAGGPGGRLGAGGPGGRLGAGGPGGRPGAASLELEPGRGSAPPVVVLIVGGRRGREGAGGGTRRPGTRGARGAPGAVSRGVAGRFPCHLCLAVDPIAPGGRPPELAEPR